MQQGGQNLSLSYIAAFIFTKKQTVVLFTPIVVVNAL